MKRKRNGDDSVVIRTIWWRHACFTLFLFLVACFFAFVGRFGPVFSWAGTLLVGLLALLSLLDQIFVWSRLLIDGSGYSLRGWFRHQKIAHHEIEDFEIVEFAGKKLLTVNLRKEALSRRKPSIQSIPFPCGFGRPVDEVLAVLRKSLDRTPRPRS